jgi:hypothetical protein
VRHSTATDDGDDCPHKPAAKVVKLRKASSPQCDAQHAHLLEPGYHTVARTDSVIAPQLLAPLGTQPLTPAPAAAAAVSDVWPSTPSPAHLRQLPSPLAPPVGTVMPQDAVLASLRVQMAPTHAALLHVRQMRAQLGEVDPSHRGHINN